MKRIPLLIALVLTFSFGLAYGNSFDVDNVAGIQTDVTDHFGNGPSYQYIGVGTDVTFNFRAINTEATKVSGMTNGVRVWTVGGEAFDQAVMTDVYPGGLGSVFDLVSAINSFSADGTGADTVGYGGSLIGGDGLAPGFDAVILAVTTGCDVDGAELCLDSSFYPPSGLWLWAGGFGSVVPDWGGPYCYDVNIIPCLPAYLTVVPGSAYTGSHCDAVSFDFDAADDDPIAPFTFQVKSGVGTIDPGTGVWSYAPSLADVGVALSAEIVVVDECAESAPFVYDLMFTNIGPSFTDGCGVTYPSGADLNVGWTVTAEDGDCDPVTVTLVGVSPTPDGTYGDFDITPSINDTGTVFTFTYEASDGNLSETCEVYVDVKGETNFSVVIEKEHGDTYYPYGVIQGQHAFIDVDMTAGSEVPAGFDFLIAYDASALSFQTATPGAAFFAGGCGWEYFNYRFGADGNCSGGCPSGVLRVVGIAETNNGPNHPTCLKPSLPATMFTLDFLVTNDRTFECQYVPIKFFWMDCGDNSLAYFPLTAPDSIVQGIENAVFNYYGGYDPNEYVEVTSIPTTFPTYFGAPDECTVGGGPGKPAPKRIIDFYNGGIDIICADDIDARGDVNLNGESNEIADAVLFSNYFIMGLDVFKVNVDGQIAATDVNADGLTLSVADLVYLIRVIVGDALPYNKLTTVDATYSFDGNTLSVDREMGGAFLTVAGNVTPTLLADNMEAKWNYNGSETRILVSSMQGNTFTGDFLQFNGQILSIEMASAAGSAANLTAMPTAYALAQNYPNPFNPTTEIAFDMLHAGEYSLTIYNVAGQKVEQFSGTAAAGPHSITWNASAQASGVYFYKFETNNFADTKKMVLLK